MPSPLSADIRPSLTRIFHLAAENPLLTTVIMKNSRNISKVRNATGGGGYVGRFAPSPTGPLHFGSLIAAVGSYLQARKMEGRWLVRMEDLDLPRVVPGAAEAILSTLESFGLFWDDEVLFQSSRFPAYGAALERLEEHLYPCGCSRAEILRSSGARGIYPGTCRHGLPPGKSPRALRLSTRRQEITFRDRIQGRYRQDLEREVGDFVVRRADGLFAYQLAVVVDDAEQGVTEVVRGSDLLDSTPRQILLQRLLGYPTPGYAHLPVITNRQGQKLSKQTHAPPLDRRRPLPALWQALDFLGQRPPRELLDGDLDAFWEWAIAHWDIGEVPRILSRPESCAIIE